jgi:hypothetical protein
VSHRQRAWPGRGGQRAGRRERAGGGAGGPAPLAGACVFFEVLRNHCIVFLGFSVLFFPMEFISLLSPPLGDTYDTLMPCAFNHSTAAAACCVHRRAELPRQHFYNSLSQHGGLPARLLFILCRVRHVC